MTTLPDIDAIEATIDAEYAAQALPHRGWELSAAHLLLAHGYAAARLIKNASGASYMQNGWPDMETRKYGLMHAFHFLHRLPSRPRAGLMASVSQECFEWAQAFLQLGAQYDSIVSVFTQYRTGIFSLEVPNKTHLSFHPVDTSDLLYDLVDLELHSPEEPHGPAIELVVNLAPLRESRSSDPCTLLASHHNRTRLIELARKSLEPIWQLPSAWSYHSVRIDELRRFWAALYLVAQTQYMLGIAASEADLSWAPTLRAEASKFRSCLAAISDLPETTVEHCLQWHVYDRTFPKSDVALTPFIDTGKNYLVTSPEILVSSRFERNFYAHIARTDRRAVDQQSHLLAHSMAQHLASLFRNGGYRAAISVPYSSTLGSGDIDLLIWSKTENAVLALELKWYIHAGDFREVINRNEMAEKALVQQLPKYRAVLHEGAQCLLSRAFPDEMPASSPVVASAGLVMRNHVGRAGLRSCGSWFAPEAALEGSMRRCKTLREIIREMESFAWLPRIDLPSHMCTAEITTPGGIHISAPAIRPMPERHTAQDYYAAIERYMRTTNTSA